jgi:hypothetical protein
MQANAMFYKVVPQRAGGFNILCGFNPKLVFATAERVTSEDVTLTTERARSIAARHAVDLNAAGLLDCTADPIMKKLLKNDEGAAFAVAVAQSFAEMGIARYEN